MNDQNHTLEDFLKDEKFINWVKTGDSELNAYWETWLLEYPEQKQAFMDAQIILLNFDFSRNNLSDVGQYALWESIRQQTIQKDQTKIKALQSRRQWFKIAAAVLVLLMTSIGIWYVQSTFEHTLMTDFGEQKEVMLPDGTTVILNANSKLTYKNSQARKVWLDGEAYFKVTKKPETGENFIVYTDDLAIKVLGTVFNVNSRNEDTEVFLEEGNVNLELSGKKQQIIEMIPGDLVNYSSKAQSLSKTTQLNPLENTAWKDGTLLFKEKPLVEVLDELSDIYGISFEFERQALQQKLITGGVPIKNLNISLETLRGVYGLTIKKQADTYTISE